MTVYAYDIGFRRAHARAAEDAVDGGEGAPRRSEGGHTRARARRRVDFRTLARRRICGTTVGFREARGNDDEDDEDDDEDIVDWTKHPSWVRRVKMKTRTKSWIASQS